MLAYLFVAKMRFLVSLAYRFEVLTSALSNIVILLASVFLWKVAYQDLSSVAAVTQNQMLVYTILSLVLSMLFVTNVQNQLHNRIREGSISIDLIRPISLLGFYLAEDLGSVSSAFLNKSLPLLVFASIVFIFPSPKSTWGFLLFIPSSLFSYAILWELSALTGLLSFWLIDLGNLGIVKDVLVRVLSGSLLPIWLFPSWLGNISALLPFQYTFQTPLSIFIGKLTFHEAIKEMSVQLIWILVFGVLVIAVWDRARRNTLVQGG